MKSRNKILTAAACAALFATAARGAKPVAMWTSYPVRSGDHVLVHGGEWGADARVEAGGRSIPATTLSDTGLVFAYPFADERIVEGRVVNSSGASEPFVVNAPTPWWIQGDAGDHSTPGGLMRMFGRSLAPYAKETRARPRVMLGGRELTVEKADVWSLDVRIPSDMPPGRHQVKISNGLAGGMDWYDAGEWSVAPKRAFWKSDVFDVCDFGAEGNDADPDSDAFDAALAAAAKNGGGVVLVPAGRYVLSRTLVIPPHVLLKGEDRSLSQICWPDTMQPPENLIEGSHSFGIHDLFISSGQYRNGIVAKTGAEAMGHVDSVRGTVTHDISLKRLRVKFVSDQWRDNNLQNFLPRYSMRGDGIVIRNCLRGEIEDCDIYCDKDAQRTLFFIFTGDYIRMAGCRINGTGWAVFGGDRCIYEFNTADNCTYSISPVCRRMFWSRNRQTDLYTNNREAVTHDGAKTAFNTKNRGQQGCASGTVDGTRVKLVYPPDIRWKSGTNYNAWVGCELQITDGRGVGQTRTIKSMKSYEELEIDRPFDLAPDASSIFVIVAERKHLIYVDNDIEDAGVAIQLYGGATDCVVARNRCRRAGGFHGSGRDYHGVITCWFIQFIGNVVEEGNCHRGSIGTDFRGAGSSLIGAFPPNVKWPFSQSYVYRDNEIRSNGSYFISVKNALVERNAVRRSDVGITSRRYQDTMFIADNTFDRVDIPYYNLQGARITPRYVDKSRETFLSQLKAGTFNKLKKSAMRRAFGLKLGVQPWNNNLRQAVAGRQRRPFKLPVKLAVDGALAEDVRSATLSIPASGGWDFGGETALAKKDGAFEGEITVTPPADGPVGMFTWPVSLTLSGDGWRFSTSLTMNPLSQNRFLSWEAALSDPGSNKCEWRRLRWLEGMDGHESIFPDKLWGKAHEGKDVRLRTRIEVAKATRFAFTRGDWTCHMYIDGKEVFRPGVNTTTPLDVTLEPGMHTIEILRPARSTFRRRPSEGMYLHCTFPDGCAAGDWVQR